MRLALLAFYSQRTHTLHMTLIKLDGFTPAPKTPQHRRLIASIEGAPKTGKTHWALDTPGPIAVFCFDKGLEGVVEKFAQTDIVVREFDFMPPIQGEKEDTIKAEASKLLDAFTTAYHKALVCAPLRTVVIDSGTMVWALVRAARFGKVQGVMPLKYAIANAVMDRLVRAGHESEKSVIWTHEIKPVYINDSRTGAYERDGYKAMGYAVQANFATDYDAKQAGDERFGLQIRDCRQNMMLAGQTARGELARFQNLAPMIFPGTSPADWGAK